MIDTPSLLKAGSGKKKRAKKPCYWNLRPLTPRAEKFDRGISHEKDLSFSLFILCTRREPTFEAAIRIACRGGAIISSLSSLYFFGLPLKRPGNDQGEKNRQLE